MINTPDVITGVNIALLFSACAVAIIMIASFRKDTLQKRSQQLFFAKILATGVGAACYAISFIHNPVPHDALNIGAEMTVTSIPGKGTTVMVTIRPQDGI